MALILGAPVMEPQGKSAAKTARRCNPLFEPCSHAADHLVDGWIGFDPEKFRHVEDPTSLTSEISLRNRSTIMRFSAWFFGSLSQGLTVALVFLRRGSARHGAFHRMGFDPSVCRQP